MYIYIYIFTHCSWHGLCSLNSVPWLVRPLTFTGEALGLATCFAGLANWLHLLDQDKQGCPGF